MWIPAENARIVTVCVCSFHFQASVLRRDPFRSPSGNEVLILCRGAQKGFQQLNLKLMLSGIQLVNRSGASLVASPMGDRGCFQFWAEYGGKGSGSCFCAAYLLC
eukprot:g3540.t1